jgi:hypothetical protein
MANSTQAKKGGSSAKKQESEQRANLFQTLLHLPPRAWSLLEIIVLVILTNHTAITDLVQLLKIMKS